MAGSLKQLLRERVSPRKLERIDLLMAFGIIEVALLIGGSKLPFFGTAWKEYTTSLIAYMIISLYYLTIIPNKEGNQLKKLDLIPVMKGVIYGFLIGWCATLALVVGLGMDTPSVPKTQALMVLIWHGIVSTNEELVFRGIMPNRVGDLGSLLLFAFLHFASYDWNVGSMAYAFVLGVVLLYAYRRTKNLGVPIGIHWGHNGVASGVLIASFIGG